MSNPFFITGIPRSGTTLLERIMDNHSEIAVCPESNLFEILHRLGVRKHFTSNWQYQQFIKEISQWLKEFNDPAYTCVQDFHNQNPTYQGDTTSLLQEIAEAYLQVRQKLIFAEKHPHHIFHQSFIRGICPEARLIILTRYPLDIVCSIAKGLHLRKPDSPKGDFYSDQFLLTAASFVKRGIRAIYRKNSFPNSKKHILKYENLVTQPAIELQKICTFLGVAFEPNMQFYDAKNYISSDSKHLPIIHEKLFQSIDSTHLFRYKRHLKEDQIAMLCLFLKKDFPLTPYDFPPSTAPLSFRQKWLVYKQLMAFSIKTYLINEGWIRFKIKIKSLAKKN